MTSKLEESYAQAVEFQITAPSSFVGLIRDVEHISIVDAIPEAVIVDTQPSGEDTQQSVTESTVSETSALQPQTRRASSVTLYLEYLIVVLIVALIIFVFFLEISKSH